MAHLLSICYLSTSIELAWLKGIGSRTTYFCLVIRLHVAFPMKAVEQVVQFLPVNVLVGYDRTRAASDLCWHLCPVYAQ